MPTFLGISISRKDKIFLIFAYIGCFKDILVLKIAVAWTNQKRP